MARPPKTELDGVPEVNLKLVDHLANGKDIDTLVRQVFPAKKKTPGRSAILRKRRKLKRKILMMIGTSNEIQTAIAIQSRAIMMAALPEASRKLASRAVRRGEPAAVKLLFEATGFHSSRVDHHHSGDIEIKLSMPRPPEAAVPSDRALPTSGRRKG